MIFTDQSGNKCRMSLFISHTLAYNYFCQIPDSEGMPYFLSLQTRFTTRGRAIAALVLVCFIWGTSWVASKEAVRDMPALQMAGIRQIWAGVMYVVFFLARGYTLPKGKQWLPIVFLAFLNFILANGLSTWGVKYISAGLGSIIGASFPLWLVILALVRYKEKPGVLTWTGLLLGFGGICIVFYDHLSELLHPAFRFGVFLSLLASLAWTAGTLYTKEHAVHFNPYFSIGLQMLISGIVLTSLTETTGLNIPLREISMYSWLNIAYLVFFSSVLAFLAYLYALQNLPTSLVSVYAYVNPIVAVLIGGLFFHERLTPTIIAGALVTITGVYLVNAALRAKNILYKPPRGRI
jgi:drug/metabolite transporter (DMT)-like permease